LRKGRERTNSVVGDGDGLLLSGSLVVSGDCSIREGESGLRKEPEERRERLTLHDSVGVNLEGDLDLGDSSRSGRDGGELELSEVVVVLGKRSLSLVDLDENGGLVVG